MKETAWANTPGELAEWVRRVEALEAENAALQREMTTKEDYVNGILSELRAIEDQISFDDKVKLPGSPRLTDCMKSLLAGYQKEQAENKRLRAALENIIAIVETDFRSDMPVSSQLLDQQIDIKLTAVEALNKEAG